MPGLSGQKDGEKKVWMKNFQFVQLAEADWLLGLRLGAELLSPLSEKSHCLRIGTRDFQWPPL